MDPSEAGSLRQRVNRAVSFSDADTADPIARSESQERQRKSKSDDEQVKQEEEEEVEEDTSRVLSVLDIIRVSVLLILASCALSYWVTTDSLIWGFKRPWWTKGAEVRAYFNGPIYLTPSELLKHDGSDPSLPIYIALNGTIYDVSRSPHMYGPGGGYSFFAGRDATRAFVTGCFKEDLTGDLRGVEEMFVPVEDHDEGGEVGDDVRVREMEEARGKVREIVAKWVRFYEGSEKYFAVGRVVGADEEKEPVRPLCEAARKQRPKRSVLRRREKERREKEEKEKQR